VEEETMTMTRREIAMLGAVGFAALSGTALAAGGDAGIGAAVEALRKAILTQDKAELEKLTAAQLSYGHSSAVVQDKAEFVNGVMTRKGTLKSLDFTEVKVGLAGDAAIARHLWHSESEMDGKPQTTKLGVLSVWHKQGGSWKLLARQGYKLPDA
jgi:ketosteroid isomerase-like protein